MKQPSTLKVTESLYVMENEKLSDKCVHFELKLWNLLIILWMSCLLSPRATSLLSIAKTVYQQKKGQNLTSFIRNPTDRGSGSSGTFSNVKDNSRSISSIFTPFYAKNRVLSAAQGPKYCE